MLIQIILVIFFLLAGAKVYGRFKAGEISAINSWFWIIFWLAAIFIVIWPNSTAALAKLLGVGRGADVIVYLSLAGLFFLFFKLSVAVAKINRALTKLTREETLKK